MGRPRHIRLHAADNVAIVVNTGGLPAGAEFDDGLRLRETVPQGHKVALADIAAAASGHHGLWRHGKSNGAATRMEH